MLKLTKKEFNELPQDVQERINAISFNLIENTEDSKQWEILNNGKTIEDATVEKEIGQSYYVLWWKGRCQGGFNSLLSVAYFIETKLIKA